MWLYIIIEIILLIVLYILILCDNIFLLNIKIKKAFNNMNIYFNKRREILFNMIGILNGYVRYEKDELRDLTQFCNYDKLENEEIIKINKELEKKIISVLSLSQKYPEIKQNRNYVILENALINNQNEITREKIQYNKLIDKYNLKLDKSLNKIVVKIFHYTKKSSY